jgi:hypothetical protein
MSDPLEDDYIRVARPAIRKLIEGLNGKSLYAREKEAVGKCPHRNPREKNWWRAEIRRQLRGEVSFDGQ